MEPSFNPTCETFEVSLSAMIDGELETPEQLPTIDHLLQCASCREFYGQARALDGMVAASAAPSTEPAPPAVWARIAGEAGLTKHNPTQSAGGVRRVAPSRLKRRYVPHVLQLAAALIVAMGLWFLWPVVFDSPEARSVDGVGVVDVVLEEDQGSMSDERFLELAMEVLRADRDYHRKMLEIMRVVDTMAARPEGSGDEPAVLARDVLQRDSIGEDGRENASRWSGDQL